MDNTNINLDNLYADQSAAINNLIPMPTYKKGKSIVTSCYRPEIPGMFVLLNELVRLDMKIPIEIFYRGNELNSDECIELAKVQPNLISLKQIKSSPVDFTDRWGNVKGWSVKVYSILESEYEENLWIDCDNVPVRNCLDLFDDPEYLKKGSLFWRDVYSVDRSNQYCDTSPFWKVFQVSPNDGEPFESGQFLLNKPLVWEQFCLMLHFTENCNLYYNFGGDAECWRMAWQNHALQRGLYHKSFNYNASDDVPYGFMPFGPFHKGVANPWKKYGGGTVMVQRDRDGKELFNHRNITKWRWENNPYNNDIQNESNYHMILRHIQSKYLKK